MLASTAVAYQGRAALQMVLGRALLGRHGRWKQYPFGPFLAGGGLLVIFVGVDRVLEQVGIASLA